MKSFILPSICFIVVLQRLLKTILSYFVKSGFDDVVMIYYFMQWWIIILHAIACWQSISSMFLPVCCNEICCLIYTFSSQIVFSSMHFEVLLHRIIFRIFRIILFISFCQCLCIIFFVLTSFLFLLFFFCFFIFLM